MEDLSGKQFGAYRIVAPLGEGGMASVYKAYQASMDRYVALKILPRHFASDPDFIHRFEREARIIARLEHPNILPVYDFGEAEGYSYLVMRFVKGGDLASSMSSRPLNPAQIMKVVSELASALEYAHDHGVIHRDLKPQNVLTDEQGNCLLSDFGLAKMMTNSSQLTISGAFVGTPTYASPEQCLGIELDSRSDIYSLGIMLYEMYTGRPPFRADTPMGVVLKHINDPLPMPRNLNPQIPESVERVILKALSKKPEERFRTAGDLADALRSAQQQASQTATIPPSLTPPPEAKPVAPSTPEVKPAQAPALASAPAAQTPQEVKAPAPAAQQPPAQSAPAPQAVKTPPPAVQTPRPASQPPIAPSQPPPAYRTPVPGPLTPPPPSRSTAPSSASARRNRPPAILTFLFVAGICVLLSVFGSGIGYWILTGGKKGTQTPQSITQVGAESATTPDTSQPSDTPAPEKRAAKPGKWQGEDISFDLAPEGKIYNLVITVRASTFTSGTSVYYLYANPPTVPIGSDGQVDFSSSNAFEAWDIEGKFVDDANLSLTFTLKRLNGEAVQEKPATLSAHWAGEASGVTATPGETKVGVQVIPVQSATATPQGLLLADAFDRPAFDYAYDPSLWVESNQTHNTRIMQINGSLEFFRSAAADAENAGLKSAKSWAPGEFRYVEARIKLNSEHKGDKGSVAVSIEATNQVQGGIWYATCGMSVGSAKPFIWCAQGNTNSSEFLFYKAAAFANYDEWHTLRVELDPQTAKLRFYVDGDLLDEWQPEYASNLLSNQFRAVLDATVDDQTTINGDVDAVTVGK